MWIKMQHPDSLCHSIISLSFFCGYDSGLIILGCGYTCLYDGTFFHLTIPVLINSAALVQPLEMLL